MAEKQNITVIMSLHELDMAQKISDLVMCVKGEYITHFGSPQEIFQRELINELYELSNGSYNPCSEVLRWSGQGRAKGFCDSRWRNRHC